MSIISIGLLLVVGLLFLLLIAGLFSRNSYTIEQSVIIEQPLEKVFNYIKFLKNQDYYHKWVMMDPAMKREFKGQDGTNGFIYGWDSQNKAGAGEQEIKEIIDGKRIDMEVRFRKPFKGVAYTFMETGAVSNPQHNSHATNVKWVFSSQLKYPFNIMLLFLNIDKTLGRDLKTSLTNLKTILEK